MCTTNTNRWVISKKKIEILQEGGADEETIESCRDSGFVRPVVLVLCAFKKDAYDIINRLRRILHGDDGKIERKFSEKIRFFSQKSKKKEVFSCENG